MKVIVFGASQGVGRLVMEQALAAGREVTAFARRAIHPPAVGRGFRSIAGDVTDASAVSAAVQGHDVVVCAIGAPPKDRTNLRTVGTDHIIRAMEASNVRRLIAVSTLGVGDSQPMLPPLLKYVIVPLILRRAFADHEAQEQRIRRSNLDWTIARPAALTDRPPTGRYPQGFGNDRRGLTFKISRADVAGWIVKEFDNTAHVRQAVGLSAWRDARAFVSPWSHEMRCDGYQIVRFNAVAD